MRICRNVSSGEKPSMIGPAPGWRNLLLLAVVCLAFIFGQEQIAHAQLGFSATGGMNAERQNHTATVLGDGRVLIAGGTTGLGATLNTAEIYNPLTGTFAPVTNTMTVPRQGHAAIRLADGRVLLIGGNTGNASAEIFDPEDAGSFAAAGSMSTARSNFTATLLNNGTVLVAGGTSSGNGGTFNNAYIYNPASGTFSAPITMVAYRRLHTATLLGDGRVLLAGGRSDTGAYLNSAQIYDPGTGSFGAVLAATMTSARESHAAVLLSDGRVLITGGNNAGTYLNAYDVFDPAGAGSFTAHVNTMAVGHYGHTATRLPNGKVLIAGGYASFAAGVTNVAELFTPVAAPGTGSFSSAGTMTKKRASHSAALLSDGSVLLAGGTGDANSLVSAELYNPAAIAVAPAFKDFGKIIVGDTSASQSFTISNTGTSSLNLTAITVSGANSAMFPLTLGGTGGCSPPQTLTAGGSCTVSVTFNPSSTGDKSATLNISSTDPEKPTLPVPLSGEGITFTSIVTVTTAGTGSGSVHSAPAGIACASGSSAGCQATFNTGTLVTLSSTTDANSLFGGWSCTTGDCGWLVACSGPGDCIIDVESNVWPTATFNYVKPAKIVRTQVTYDTFSGAQGAYTAALTGDEIQARAYTFNESPNFAGGKSITINGGYDVNYSSNSGFYSVFSGGSFTIGTGTITLSNIVVQ